MIELSIIVPIYNGSESLVVLINSIEYFNEGINDIIEILLIDDESTDNSIFICEDLSKKYSNIRVFSIEHGGVGKTRNYGLTVARGKYITFCDQDDEVIKGYDSFLKKTESSQAELLISNYTILHNGNICNSNKITEERVCEHEVIREMTKRLFSIPTIIGESYYSHIPRFYPSIWNCIFLAETIKKNGIEISSYIEYDDDWKLLLEVLSVSNKVYLCTESYYKWTYNSHSQSHSTKYIPEFTSLRKDLRDYSLRKMQSLSFMEEEIESVLATFDKETILKTFMNYKNCSYRDFIMGLKSIYIDFSLKNKTRILSTSTNKEKIWLLLFYSKLHWLSWLFIKKQKGA
ncbi:MAG: glycosyltransferase [Prevotella sp.]|nr:glycosyltransferase [Prevotella sp.]